MLPLLDWKFLADLVEREVRFDWFHGEGWNLKRIFKLSGGQVLWSDFVFLFRNVTRGSSGHCIRLHEDTSRGFGGCYCCQQGRRVGSKVLHQADVLGYCKGWQPALRDLCWGEVYKTCWWSTCIWKGGTLRMKKFDGEEWRSPVFIGGQWQLIMSFWEIFWFTDIITFTVKTKSGHNFLVDMYICVVF